MGIAGSPHRVERRGGEGAVQPRALQVPGWLIWGPLLWAVPERLCFCRLSPSSSSSCSNPLPPSPLPPRPCRPAADAAPRSHRRHRQRRSMRRPWTGRRSLSRGESPSLSTDPSTYPRRLTAASGLVLGSSYLSTSLPTTFALDRPLHTVAVVLLLSGLAIVAYETRAQKTRRPPTHDRYVAIPLVDPNARPSSEVLWPLDHRSLHRCGLAQRSLAALLAALLILLAARIALFYAVIKDVECSAPTLTVRLTVPYYQTYPILTSTALSSARPRPFPRIPRAQGPPAARFLC